MPFGGDHNDLPLFEMQSDMNRNLTVLMSSRSQGVPQFSFNPAKHCLLEEKIINYDDDLLYFTLNQDTTANGTEAVVSVGTESEHVDAPVTTVAPEMETLTLQVEMIQEPKETQGAPLLSLPEATNYQPTPPLVEEDTYQSVPCEMPAPETSLVLPPHLRLNATQGTVKASHIETQGAPNFLTSSDLACTCRRFDKPLLADGMSCKPPRALHFREHDEELVMLTVRMEDHLSRIATELAAISYTRGGRTQHAGDEASRQNEVSSREQHSTAFMSQLFGKCSQ
jgi:hypothetical protein